MRGTCIEGILRMIWIKGLKKKSSCHTFACMRERLDRPKQSYLSIFFARATRETTPELPLVSAELLLLYNAATLHPFLMPKGFKLCTAINLSIYLSIYIYIYIYTVFIHVLSRTRLVQSIPWPSPVPGGSPNRNKRSQLPTCQLKANILYMFYVYIYIYIHIGVMYDYTIVLRGPRSGIPGCHI